MSLEIIANLVWDLTYMTNLWSQFSHGGLGLGWNLYRRGFTLPRAGLHPTHTSMWQGLHTFFNVSLQLWNWYCWNFTWALQHYRATCTPNFKFLYFSFYSYSKVCRKMLEKLHAHIKQMLDLWFFQYNL